MEINLTDVGKRYNRQWIFKGIHYQIKSNSSLALVGNNGSGKSTLLQLIYNYQTISKGNIQYLVEGRLVEDQNLYSYFSFVAPYLDLPEEFTLNEIWDFNFSLKKLKPGIQKSQIFEQCGLAGNENKFIKHFSSGMKQRLKLILALYAETPVLLLDEPCSNLDKNGIIWYRKTMFDMLGTRTILVASNQLDEYDFCEGRIEMHEFKNF
ncbi:MAG: ABC transporter ATP-binding protein [Bacteroidia bacterium]